MKREVWVECERNDVDGFKCAWNNNIRLKQTTLHESRWIPVSERMPTVPDHYLVVRLDRLDWCYCELKGVEPYGEGLGIRIRPSFTSKGVTHWLEAPPLPVEEEFNQWLQGYDYQGKSTLTIARAAWNAAKESI